MNDMKDIAGAINSLANAITPSKAIPGRDAAGVHVESLIELWCDASLANSGSGWFVVSGAFARAIKAAHGVKE